MQCCYPVAKEVLIDNLLDKFLFVYSLHSIEPQRFFFDYSSYIFYYIELYQRLYLPLHRIKLQALYRFLRRLIVPYKVTQFIIIIIVSSFSFLILIIPFSRATLTYLVILLVYSIRILLIIIISRSLGLVPSSVVGYFYQSSLVEPLFYLRLILLVVDFDRLFNYSLNISKLPTYNSLVGT